MAPSLSPAGEDLTSAIREGLALLGVRRMVLAIHDQSFPSRPEEDVGRGSPYGNGARDLLRFAASWGFDGVQLGPQGDTALDNPSPYDGALFSRSPMSIALATLAEEADWAPLCGDGALLDSLRAAGAEGGGDRVRYREAWRAARSTVAALFARFAEATDRYPALSARFGDFRRRRRQTLEVDGAFEALAVEHGSDDWRLWPEDGGGDPHSADKLLCTPPAALRHTAARRWAWLRAERAPIMERHAFGQFILHEQHAALRRNLSAAPSRRLALYGDLPIGFSHRDVWSRGALFRRDYLMGAPPSRTNPDGQPWGFPVLDPDQYFADGGARAGAPGPVLELLNTRVDMLLDDFDGIRVDHPHGLVCPWVYAADDPDPSAAVARGARLFCSPNVPEHPQLQRLAIPSADQLSADPGIARYADDWVRQLRDDQVTSYGVLFDALMNRVAALGRDAGDVVCEVLSTWPYPLRRVMERHELGRFCVLQKADLARPDDVYRSENVSERDWIMVGNHDTRPIWLLSEGWAGTPTATRWAAYLAERLMPSPVRRARLARWIAADGRNLCQAMFGAIFASRARHVSVFFADLFGLREVYNRPGVVDGANWTLRLSSDWQALHGERVSQLKSLNLPLALALALVSRPGAPARATSERLIRAARSLTPALDEEILSLLDPATLD